MCLPRLGTATLVGFVITAPVPDQGRRGRALSDRSLQAAMILDQSPSTSTLYRHSRESGNPPCGTWIPAFAGMTDKGPLFRRLVLDRTFGYLLALTAVLLWAVFSNVAKYLFQQGLAVTDLTTIRIVIAAGVLWTVACFNPVGAFRPSALSASNPPRGAWPFLIAFGLSLWAMMFTFYQAISYLGVALGVIIQFTHPLLIILFGAAVLGERITRIAVVAVTCIMVGVILIVQVFEAGQVQVSGIGVVWGLISAVANAAYLLLGRYVQNGYQTGPSLLWGFAVAAVLAVVWGLAQSSVGVGVLLGSAENLLSGIGIGVIGTLGAFALMLLATAISHRSK